jgi:DNA polymerase-3 subunit delta'
VGHTQVIEHLKNARKLNKVSHAYIINGEKGSGKKLLASAFAQVMQCEENGEDRCGICRSCKQAESGNHPDIIRITHEKPNSISVDEIREQLINDVQIKPYSSKYKIYIVPDTEKMTVQAQNALLKTIEEPPAYAIILLLTTNASGLLPTILSRCVMLNMKPVPDRLVKEYLMDHLEIPDYQADICVAFAHGNIGQALELATSDNFNEIKSAALYLVKHVPRMEIPEINAAVRAVSEFKVNIDEYMDLLAVWYCDVLYFKATKDIDGLAFKEEVQSISEQANKTSYEGLEEILESIQKAKVRLGANVNFDLTMELLFTTIKENFA